VSALVAGAVLWPPGPVYWTALSARVGDGPTLALVVVLAASLGVVLASATDVRVPEVTAGALVAYVAGMAAVAAVSTPDSPAHLVWYGVLATAFVGGAALRRRQTARAS
jgi:hypothetical protein